MPSDEELLFGLRPNLTFDVIPAIWDNRPNVIRRADAFDAVALARHQPGSQQHVPQALTAVEASVDDTNADVVTRWAEGNITAAEIGRWREQRRRVPLQFLCAGCLWPGPTARWPYAARVSAHCRCVACICWRREMALGIQGVILGRMPEPVRSYSVSLSDILRDDREVRRDRDRVEAVFTELPEPNWHAAAEPPRIETRAEREARELNMTPFERVRSRRGHPVPQLALAADWKPNQWEA
jgi:hypothetical protein